MREQHARETPRAELEPMLSTPEFCALLGISARTAEDWRLKHAGPEYVRVGRLVRYRRSAVQRWLLNHTVRTQDVEAA